MCPGQRLLKVHIIEGHPGEDIVGGPVDDPDHARDPVGHEAVLERADQGNASANAGFIVNVPAAAVSQLQKLPAVPGHQIFVGGNDMFIFFERRADQGARRFDPAHELHDNINRGIFDHRIRIGRIGLRRQINRPGP